MGYDGLLIDHDGVLVTLGDERALRSAAREALAAVGVTDPDPATVEAIQIRVDDDDLRSVSRRYDLDPDELWRQRDERVDAALRDETRAGRKRPYDDVSALDSLAEPTGIVSNNQTRLISFVLDHYGMAEWFETIRAREPTRASLTRKKPRPTYLTDAADDIGVSNPLYVGDSETDVVAGERAGFDVAFLRRDHNADRSLDVDPTYDVTGLDEVVEILDENQ